jgi:hypothetical protein
MNALQLFWKRVYNLRAAMLKAEDPEFKLMWRDKLWELLHSIGKHDKRTLH